MPIDKLRAIKMFDTLAKRLNIEQLKETTVESYLSVFDENKMQIFKLENACRVLQATWKSNTFPKPSHFIDAADEKIPYRPDVVDEDRKYPDYILEASKKLGIHPSRVPSDARNLTDEQRRILGLTKYWRFVKNAAGIPIKVEFSETLFQDMALTNAMLSDEKRKPQKEFAA